LTEVLNVATCTDARTVAAAGGTHLTYAFVPAGTATPLSTDYKMLQQQI
jgi:hypothetical protein